MQSKYTSLKEAMANMVFGYVVYVAALSVLSPTSLTSNLKIGIVLRLLSFVVNYAVRRWFNREEHKNAS